MAGTENSGPQSAFKELFAKKTVVICDPEQSHRDHLRRVKAMYDALKMRVIFMSSIEHDLHAAYVSHLSHISSFVLANTVLSQEKSVSAIFDLAGGGFESTVRLAKSSAEMWVPIFENNRENILSALESYIEHLQLFRQILVDQKWNQARQMIESANGIRRVLDGLITRRPEA
jgi:prephenate dehydrogenase